MPKCTIDEREIEVAAGTTVIEAARARGVSIPHFCWHPDLSVDGNCRMCVVEIEGSPKLQISCNTPVTDGMIVRTRTPRVLEARRQTLEMLLINHPIDCPVCDQAGECFLQNYYMDHGLYDSKVDIADKVKKHKVADLGPIVLDSERCVLCSRCIRFEREVTRTNQLEFAGRGDRTEIATFDSRPITHNYAGNLVDVCPVGALLSRDFRFRMRVWFLKSTPSICPGCSTGCNIHIDHRDGVMQRLRPRRNPDVNQSWMCDIGRALYKDHAAPSRVMSARLRDGDSQRALPFDEALDVLAARIRAAVGSTAFLASPQATNEDLYAFRLLSDSAAGLLDFRIGDPQDRTQLLEDGVLLRIDRNPNTQGCRELDLGRSGLDEIIHACRAGRVKALVLQEPELLRMPAAGIFLESVPFVAVMATRDEPSLERAQLVIPVASWAEIDGTFVNHARRIQRLNRAIPPPDDARPRWRIAAEALARLGHPLDAASERDVLSRIIDAVPAFADLDPELIGDLGCALSSSAIGATR